MPLKSKRTFHIWKKMLLAGLIFAGLCGGFVAGTNLWMWKSASPYIDTEEEPADSGPKDCILVLGAGVYENNQPSPMLKERLDQAIVLYENHVSDKIIVSGDHNKTDYDEVNVMKTFLKQAGIPDDAIFMDHAGLNTYDSMYRARHIFQVNSAAIVTQKYHMYRSVYLARSIGIDAYGFPCDRQSFSGAFAREIREILARTKDFAYAVWQPEARIMGDAIPVSGSGSQTNDRN